MRSTLRGIACTDSASGELQEASISRNGAKASTPVRISGIPPYWRRYVTLDYGLDMLAAYFIAMDTSGGAWVYKEIYESGLSFRMRPG